MRASEVKGLGVGSGGGVGASTRIGSEVVVVTVVVTGGEMNDVIVNEEQPQL